MEITFNMIICIRSEDLKPMLGGMQRKGFVYNVGYIYIYNLITPSDINL